MGQRAWRPLKTSVSARSRQPLNRDVNEGESPFRFDALSTSQTRTDLTSSLSFTQLPWFSLDVNETYVFVDTRNPEDLGAGPIESRLALFNNLSWLDIEVANDYDPEENAPGNLETLFELRSPDPVVSGGLRYEQIVDLDLAPTAPTVPWKTTPRHRHGGAWLHQSLQCGPRRGLRIRQHRR